MLLPMTVDPRVSGAYVSGDVLGHPIAFTGAFGQYQNDARIPHAVLIDMAKVGAPVELWLFDRLLTGTITGYLDNAAFDPLDADMVGLVGVLPFSSGSYFQGADNSVAQSALTQPIPIKGKTNANLWGVFVARSGAAYALGELTCRVTFQF